MEILEVRRQLAECLDRLDQLGHCLAAARLDMALLALDEDLRPTVVRDNVRDYDAGPCFGEMAWPIDQRDARERDPPADAAGDFVCVWPAR